MWVHRKNADEEILIDKSVSIFTALYALGDMTAGILGNYLFLKVGFAWTCNIVGIICLTIGCLYISFCFEK